MKVENSSFSILKSKGVLGKLVLGGLFSLLFFTVYFAFVVVGYKMHVLCSALEGRKSKLPDWKGFRTLFHEGIQPVLITLAYLSPIGVLITVEMNVATASSAGNTYLWPIELLLILAISAFLPMALIRSIVKTSLKSAFEFKAIGKFIAENTTVFISAWAKSAAIYMAEIALGMALLIVTGMLYFKQGALALVAGSIITGLFGGFVFFTCNIVIAHVFARAYRLSKPFSDDQFGETRASMTMPPPLNK